MLSLHTVQTHDEKHYMHQSKSAMKTSAKDKFILQCDLTHKKSNSFMSYIDNSINESADIDCNLIFVKNFHA